MKRNIKYICILLSAVLFIGLFSGCSLYKLPAVDGEVKADSTPAPSTAISAMTSGDKMFSINFSSKYGLNPLNNLNKVNQTAAAAVYEGLFVLDDDFNFHPLLCENWYTNDGLSYTFNIKSGVTFHDGSALTAYDVVYSLNRAKNSGAYSSRFSSVAGISAWDSQSFSITLSKVNMLFPVLLDIPIIKSGAIKEKNPVGTGPYAFSQGKDYYYLSAHKGYRDFESLPVKDIYLQEYDVENIISAFEGGFLDLVSTDPTDAASVNFGGNCEIHYYDTTYLQYLGFNMSGGFLSMPEARLAVSYAIDRTYIASRVMAYSAQEAYIPTSLSNEALTKLSQQYLMSEGKAKGILISSGVADYNNDGWIEYKSGGVPIQFTVRFIANKDNKTKLAAAKSIADSLIKLGINVEFLPLTWDDYVYALEEGNYDMYYADVKLKADFDLSDILLSGGSLNFGGIKDEGYKALLDAYYAANDEMRPSAAEALYSDIAATVPIVPVVFRYQAMVTMRGVVTGASPTQSSVFNGIKDWKIEFR